MCFIIGNDSASSYFASRTCRRRDSNKMRHIISNIYIAANQVIIFKKIFAMIYSQHNSPCNIQCSATANSDDRISFCSIINICSFIYI